jgi:hypothetical protein
MAAASAATVMAASAIKAMGKAGAGTGTGPSS